LSPDRISYFSYGTRRADRATIATFKNALKVAGVEGWYVLSMFRRPGEEARRAVGRYWKPAVYISGWATMSDG